MRDLETKMPPVARALAPFLLPSTWGAVAYVWIAFPLGLLYFVGLTVGLTVGTALTIVWVGLALLLATFLAAWGAEGLERGTANFLLGARVPERRAGWRETETLWQWLRGVFKSAALWKGLVFLFLKFPLGLAGWIFSVVSLSVSAALVATPVLFVFGRGDVSIDFYVIDSVWGTLPLAFLGLAGLIVSLHAHRGMGWLWARLAEGLLGEGSPAAWSSRPEPPATDLVAA